MDKQAPVAGADQGGLELTTGKLAVEGTTAREQGSSTLGMNFMYFDSNFTGVCS